MLNTLQDRLFIEVSFRLNARSSESRERILCFSASLFELLLFFGVLLTKNWFAIKRACD